MEFLPVEDTPQPGSQSIKQLIKLEQSLRVLPGSHSPHIIVEIFEQMFMDLLIGVRILSQQPQKVLEGPTTTVDLFVFARNKKISQVEILLHEEGDVDGGYREEEACLVLLH